MKSVTKLVFQKISFSFNWENKQKCQLELLFKKH